MKNTYSALKAALLGIACGFVSTHIISIGWLNLGFWAIAGVALGLFSAQKKVAIWNGAVFGFTLSMSFLLSGFGGTSDKFGGFLLFSFLLSFVGILGGLITVFGGYWLRNRF